MADDLAKFIESQKRKLEQERAELLRGTDIEDRSRTSTTGYKEDSRYSQGQPNSNSETKAVPSAGGKESSNFGGLNLGGYEEVQQKLRQERHEEYRQYLAEKKFRSTGRIDPILVDGGRSNLAKDLGEARREPRKDDVNGYNETLPRRRRGKENYDDSPRNYDYRSEERGNQRPANLFESYEDLLQRKRAQERRYRNLDEPDPGFGRPMRLNAPQYKHNSRSDGYLSRRFDDDDNEWSYRNRPRGRRERSFESKRVRFQGEEDVDDDSTWVKPRRRLDYYDDDDDDEEELLDWLRKRGRRPPRRNSAHARERQASKDEPLQRSRTDTEIRSQSAPLEGAGVIGGYEESKTAKIKRQEQYKKELQNQMQEQADIKKREKMQRMGLQQGPAELPSGIPQNSQIDSTPPSVNKGSHPSQPLNYSAPLTNQGPSSRPPPHPALFPNLYDNPYYYHDALEMGAPRAMSMGVPVAGPLNTSSGVMQSNEVAARADTRMSAGYTTPVPGPVLEVGGGAAVSPRGTFQPPGGYSSLGALGTDQQSASDKKKAAQQAYQEELKKQMEEKNLTKIKEKEEKERYDRKIEQEIANYNPWGKGGGGAPLRDSTGHLVANLRTLKQYNDEGIKVSPRDQPLSVQEAYLSPHPGVTVQSGIEKELKENVGKSSFGRSDPLKEPQPQEELKKAAKQEYQEYLRKQVEEKERKKREELEQQKREDELLEKRINEERAKMQKDFEKEQEDNRKKEEQARLKNEEIKEAHAAKKREAERKRKEMEEQRQAELKRKLDEEMAAKRAAAASGAIALHERSNSPPIPTVQKKLEEAGQGGNDFRSSSPPIPTIAKQHNLQQLGPVTPPQAVQALHTEAELSKGTEADRDVLSQLTALRQQLKIEEKKVQQQMDHTTAVTKYSKMQRAPEDLGSRRSRRDVDVFERALANKNAGGKSESETFSAAQEFNRIKNEETSSLAEEFRSKFPDPVATNSVLDLQQQAFLMEQEDKLLALRSDIKRQNKHLGKGGQQPQFSRRPVSRDSLLESESQFLAVEDPKEVVPVEQMHTRPRQSSARERRRWKQLEEMARNPKSYDTYKPPTPGGFSLGSVTSFNVEEVAAQNEERLKRLEMIQQGRQGRSGSRQGDPDRVLQRFIDEHRHPPLLSRLSNQSLEAETSFEPI